MYDYHMHSDNSADCRASMMDMARACVLHGLAEVAFTDHLDTDYPSREDPFGVVDLVRYFADIEETRRAYPQLRIRSGFEFGDTPGSREELMDIVRQHRPDFVLLSCHVVDGRDPYHKSSKYFEVHPTRRAAYDAYLDALLKTALAWEDFGYSSFAHIGYVVKPAPYPEGERALIYEEHAERIDAILRSIVRAGAALEINTSGYRAVGEPIPSGRILGRFRELGGEVVTLGSDAHHPAHVALRFNTARALALDAGLRWTAVFEDGKRRELPL